MTISGVTVDLASIAVRTTRRETILPLDDLLGIRKQPYANADDANYPEKDNRRQQVRTSQIWFRH
jgi:hypothetical protein